jgi:solute carrier family 35 protein E3
MIVLDQPNEDVERTNKKLLEGEKPSRKDVSPIQKGLRKQLIDGACILLNIASTVTLVFLNKWYVCVDARNGSILLTVGYLGSSRTPN